MHALFNVSTHGVIYKKKCIVNYVCVGERCLRFRYTKHYMLKLVRTTHQFISSQRYSGINLYVASNLVDPRIHQRFISVFNGAISQTSTPFPSFSQLFCSPPFSRPLALSSFFLALRLFCWFWGLENEACHYMMSNGL